MAHVATLENKGKTIAILGNGLNKIYPEENIWLYKEIIKNGGLVISEYEPNEEASSKKFLQRNRIVSGIAMGILIIEAKYRSGTSVTARLAKEQEKKIFAIPHEIGNICGTGTNNLIKEGIAKLVVNADDIIKEFEELRNNKIEKICTNQKNNSIQNNKKKLQKETQKEQKNIKRENNKNINIEENTKIQHKRIIKKIKIVKNKKYLEKDKIEAKIKNEEYINIYRLIKKGINNIDEISKKTQKNIAKLNEILLMLEIEGYIIKTAGGYKCT